MLDYRGIEALFSVIKTQNFEKAASDLHITQSAISQRIKSLEVFYGEPVLIRTLPYRPTELGYQLIRLLTQMQLLEQNFAKERDEQMVKPRISIALNRDSLETWFLPAMRECSMLRDILLDVKADDQELTLTYFKNGLVSACLSTEGKALSGADATFMGIMRYIQVATAEFIERYPIKRDVQRFFEAAPALRFDENDHLPERYIKHFFSITDIKVPCHVVPSVAGFKQFALLGYGYGLIPEIDIVDELKAKKLLNIFPDKTWDVPLYWHSWSIKSDHYEKVNSYIIKSAKQRLAAAPS